MSAQIARTAQLFFVLFLYNNLRKKNRGVTERKKQELQGNFWGRFQKSAKL
jgi:predicted nucleotidyltransferase